MPLVLAVSGAVVGCSHGEEATPEAVAQAQERWTKAGILDYTLEWTVTGPNNAHYYVTVERGEVSEIEAAAPDGRRLKVHSAAPRYFGVDGLFLTIANEIALMKSDRPFSQPKGTKVVMRFQPDSQLGYPHWYRRDVMGTAQSMTIDVLKLVPRSPAPRHSIR
jgi:Family of unknown function (DUF6174)